MHRPTDQTPADVVHAVYERRRAAKPEDPDLDRFPDPEDLPGVVAYLSRYQRVGPDVLGADALDQLRILDHMLWKIDRARLAAMRAARRHGKTWQEIADALGVGTRQGAEALFVRLSHAAVHPGNKKVDQVARAERRLWQSEFAADHPPASPPVTARVTRLRAFLDELLRNADQIPEGVVENLQYARDEIRPEHLDAHLRQAVDDIWKAGSWPAVRELTERYVEDLTS
jgi:hypothetical protein